jgi:hypothetical protein
MIRFTDYAKISNNYCICYFGHANEYLVQLRLLQPIIESRLKGLNIFLGCKDECVHLLAGFEKTLKISELKSRKDEFAHIREIQFNNIDHPIEALMSEANIQDYVVPIEPAARTRKCVICTKSHYPTMPLTKPQIKKLKSMAMEEGYEPMLDIDIGDAGLVMGVECQEFFQAAAKGIETRLVPTGIGARLYEGMFQRSKVLNLDV